MLIGGLIKLSLVDYPRHTAAVVFTQGCNFRCPYCHNRELVLPEYFQSPLQEAVVFEFLKKRQGVLEGVVITGGEPTNQKDLDAFIVGCKSLGYRIKLDTNGSRPEILKPLLREKLLDFVAMDYKAPLARYSELTGVNTDIHKIQESLHILKQHQQSGFEYQIRTTLLKGWLQESDLLSMKAELGVVSHWQLQNFVHRPSMVSPQCTEKQHYEQAEFEQIQARSNILDKPNDLQYINEKLSGP